MNILINQVLLQYSVTVQSYAWLTLCWVELSHSQVSIKSWIAMDVLYLLYSTEWRYWSAFSSFAIFVCLDWKLLIWIGISCYDRQLECWGKTGTLETNHFKVPMHQQKRTCKWSGANVGLFIQWGGGYGLEVEWLAGTENLVWKNRKGIVQTIAETLRNLYKQWIDAFNLVSVFSPQDPYVSLLSSNIYKFLLLEKAVCKILIMLPMSCNPISGSSITGRVYVPFFTSLLRHSWFLVVAVQSRVLTQHRSTSVFSPHN